MRLALLVLIAMGISSAGYSDSLKSGDPSLPATLVRPPKLPHQNIAPPTAHEMLMNSPQTTHLRQLGIRVRQGDVTPAEARKEYQERWYPDNPNVKLNFDYLAPKQDPDD